MALALLAIGAARGASANSLTHPAIDMVPKVTTQTAKLAAATSIVLVKGRVAEVYGDRFVIEYGSGRAIIDAGRDKGLAITRGSEITLQGRLDDEQLRLQFKSFLMLSGMHVSAQRGTSFQLFSALQCESVS